jgi:hypothetical protein
MKNAVFCDVTSCHGINIVTCFEWHVSETAFKGQRIRNFVGNRLVEVYICGNAQATEISKQVFTSLEIRSCLSRGRQFKRSFV